MRTNTNRKEKIDKFASIFLMIFSLSILALAIIMMLGLVKASVLLIFPIVSVVLFIQAYLNWHNSRKISILALVIAVFVLLYAIITLILH